MYPKEKPSMKTIVSTVASVAATAMLVRGVARDIVPKEMRHYLLSSFHSLCRRFSSEFTVVIEEFQEMSTNRVFEAVNIYLGTIVNPTTRRVKIGKTDNDKNLVIGVDRGEEVVDFFENVQVKWTLVCIQIQAMSQNHHELRDMGSSLRSELRSYELSFHKKHKEMIVKSYIPYILERSKAIKEEGKAIKFLTNHRNWLGSGSVNLHHPMTFNSLAMDLELRNLLIEDLNNFVKGKDFYKKIGKAWKRGYLLYGPPGTGKSSLVAAMANYLNYDIYDLDLSEVRSNSKLRSLLLGISGRTIIVIEDIDCSINIENRTSEKMPEKEQNTVTLSGVLNFIDGLWSCSAEERIIVITTNHIERLDPALLRPGRMDMHIHMSYCNFSAFKQLATNYLGIDEHILFEKVKELLGEAQVTPADVGGELIKSSDPRISLQGLLTFLDNKINAKRKLQNLNGSALQDGQVENESQESMM